MFIVTKELPGSIIVKITQYDTQEAWVYFLGQESPLEGTGSRPLHLKNPHGQKKAGILTMQDY